MFGRPLDSPLPFLLVVGSLMFWRAGVGVCGPEFPWDFSFEEGW
jgi:hypothetical protein